MTSPTLTRTPDSTILACCPQTGRVVSGRLLGHAVERLSCVRPADGRAYMHMHEGKP